MGNVYKTHKSRYEQGREAARAEAVEWQASFGEHDYSWYELAEWQEHFKALGKRYGLLKEFRENGIC